jgi:mediator of RNA polymerase II transcription subunit 13
MVLYIITPPSVNTATSSTLRPLLSAIKRVQKTYPDAGILIHLVPEALASGGLDDTRAIHGGLEVFVTNVYDRIPETVERTAAKKLPESDTQTRASFHSPAFVLSSTLAGPDYGPHQSPRVSFALETHPSSLDVVERYSFLHVGYQISSCRRWLLAACIDGRGEEHDLGAWLLPSESQEAFVVSQVWSFVRVFAARASIEWRITITKLGQMREGEIDGELLPGD